MGRKKFSADEVKVIRKLLGSKMRGNRSQQKMSRHILRTVFGFNISDFNVQGKAFGPEDLTSAYVADAYRFSTMQPSRQ